MWIQVHTVLQEACIDFWPTAEDCRTLLADSGVDSSRMSFDEPNALRWESIIKECDKQRSLDKLVPVLLDRYPNNPTLQRAVKPWIQGNPKEIIKMSRERRAEKTEDTQEVEVELVPVIVPREFAEDASLALVATINSFRRTLAQHEQNLQELMKWRQEISKLSRAEVAVTTGANEHESPKSKK